ncbi:MAG: replication-relaxation family protein [Anaerolineae bacterium]
MTSPRWADALVLQHDLATPDRALLLLLARLPFLSAHLAAPLAGGVSRRQVERQLHTLAELGTVEGVQPATQPGHTARLYYPTDLGLAVVALGLGVDVHDLARYLRLQRDDLLARLPGILPLLAAYELLAAVATSRAGEATLLAWICPWRVRFRRLNARLIYRITVPAYAALAWDGGCAEYLLLPDQVSFPFGVYRRMLADLALWQLASGLTLPPLVIAAPSAARASLWYEAVATTSRRCPASPLTAAITAWAKRPDTPELLAHLPRQPRENAPNLTQWIKASPLLALPPASRLPNLAGELEYSPMPRRRPARLGRVSLRLSPADYRVLDLLGRHPYLTVEDIASVMGWTVRWAQEEHNRLTSLGLVRTLIAQECSGVTMTGELAELTYNGLGLVAARQGLPLVTATRVNGLAGGGSDHPTGARRKLLQTLPHTLGVNHFFAGAYRTAASRRERGHDDALVEWRNAVACSQRLIRPDGYGLYRRDGNEFGFFLELDRGTMKTRQYYAKFAAYYAYLEHRLFERDYDGMPTVLIVTTDAEAEDRMAYALRQMSTARSSFLPALLTTAWRLEDHQHADGLLSPIWRTPSLDNQDRIGWPIAAVHVMQGQHELWRT